MDSQLNLEETRRQHDEQINEFATYLQELSGRHIRLHINHDQQLIKIPWWQPWKRKGEIQRFRYAEDALFNHATAKCAEFAEKIQQLGEKKKRLETPVMISELTHGT